MGMLGESDDVIAARYEEFNEPRHRGYGGGGHGGGGSGGASGAGLLLKAGVWLFAWITVAYFLVAPAIAIFLSARYPEVSRTRADLWTLVIGSPFIAFLVVWRADHWRRPIRWQRILVRGALLLALCTSAGLCVELSCAQGLSKINNLQKTSDPQGIWGVLSVLVTVTVWPVGLAFSGFVRLKQRRALPDKRK